MKLSIELDNLSKRGIKIKFSSMNTKVNFVCSDGITKPLFCFVLGNEELLSSDNIKVVSKYSDFQKNKGDQIIFTIDRNFETLLSYNDIIESLENKSILQVSNLFGNKSEIKVAVSDERSKGKVFISGSRSQDEIPNNIQMSLKAIMERNIEVLIGDSDKGVDNQIIDYFRDSYDRVEVFTIKQRSRVKIEDTWKIRTVEFDQSLTAVEKQMTKDRGMAKEADWGLAIFKPITKNRYGSIQVSSGTLRNTIQMLLDKKPVKFFYVFENEMQFEDLKLIEDLEKVISRYREEKLSALEKEEIMSSNGVKTNSDFICGKFNKIRKKFKELVVKERKLMKEKDKESDEEKPAQLSMFGL